VPTLKHDIEPIAVPSSETTEPTFANPYRRYFTKELEAKIDAKQSIRASEIS